MKATRDSVLELCRNFPVREFEPGAVLLDEGNKSGLLYVLIDGEVEIVKGDFQINVVNDPGAIFGEISVLMDIPHMATVRALTSCRVHKVADGDAFLKANPEISYYLALLLARRLYGVSTYLVDLKPSSRATTIISPWSMMSSRPWLTSNTIGFCRARIGIPAFSQEPIR